jgi:hypothetical protein
VIQSGFEMEIKRHWLGKHWYLPGAAGNDIHKVSSPSACCVASCLKLNERLRYVDQCSRYPAHLPPRHFNGRADDYQASLCRDMNGANLMIQWKCWCFFSVGALDWVRDYYHCFHLEVYFTIVVRILNHSSDLCKTCG